jgi:sulfatase maturation enzyme AslB (radical SAM superfamily)
MSLHVPTHSRTGRGRGADLRRLSRVKLAASLVCGCAAAVLVSGRAWMGGVPLPGRGPVVVADPSPPARGEPTSGVGDRLGRPLRDLRVSVTDRCNFRCPYCMPKTVFGRDHEFLPRAEILSFEEITRVVGAAAALGVTKVRLTGGEPLVRRDLERLVAGPRWP